jgi:prophage antirepressor-like protein
MANITVLHFQQNQLRYVGDGVSHEWVAQDVFEAMGLKWNSDLIADYDESEKGTTLIGTLGGEQKVITLKESGLYTAMLRGRNAMKPGTVQYTFRKWITGEVIPALRANGEYSINREKLEKQFLPEITAQNRLDAIKLLKAGGHDKAYIQRISMQMAKAICPGIEPPSPAEMISLPTAQALLTPTEIAQELGKTYKSGLGDARWVNQKLFELGYQEKIAGAWSATPKAINLKLCDRKPVETNSRTQKDQLMWSAKIIDILKEHVIFA